MPAARRKFLTALPVFLLALAGCLTASPTSPPAAAVTPPLPASTHAFQPTYTPMPTGTPTQTATPRPTRTPQPTTTLGPTALSSPTPLVSVITAAAGEQPLHSSNLLFLSDGRLKIWRASTGEIIDAAPDILPGDVVSISLSLDTGRVALLRHSSSGDEILVFEPFSETVLAAITMEGQRVFDAGISPDGNWLALITSGSKPGSAGSPPAPTPTLGGDATGTPEPAPSPQPDYGGTVTLIRLDSAASGLELGQCGRDCSGISWSPLSDSLLWSDRQGLWEAGTSGDRVRVLPPLVTGISGSGQTRDGYLPLAFSLSGRYLVVRKGLEEGTVLALVDRMLGTFENLPGSASYTGAGTGFTWLPGDLLLIARPGVARLELGPAIELWQINPLSSNSVFLQAGIYDLPGDYYAAPASPTVLPDGRVAFTLINFHDANDAAVNGLYILDLPGGVLERVNYLPLLKVESTVWLPDQSGALVSSSSRLLFVPASYGQVFSMSVLLGTDACCFSWIP